MLRNRQIPAVESGSFIEVAYIMIKILFPGLLALLLIAPQALAQNPDPAAPPPIPPVDAPPRLGVDEDVPIPPKVLDDSELIEPTVQISRDENDNLVEEYSLDGRVYMVKITPKVGLPYYYLDDDGDGQLELNERDRAANPVKPVYWKVKEWD